MEHLELIVCLYGTLKWVREGRKECLYVGVDDTRALSGRWGDEYIHSWPFNPLSFLCWVCEGEMWMGLQVHHSGLRVGWCDIVPEL